MVKKSAQGPRAAFRGPAALRNHCGGSNCLSAMAVKIFQLNGSLHCLGLLIGVLLELKKSAPEWAVDACLWWP